MKKIKYLFIAFILLASSSAFANGLLMPTKTGYPKDFLKIRSTEVTVNIHGLVAETTVYQEFVNEWYDTTDAVFSFPLPPDARATEFLYWYHDTLYTAVLKVKEQATNPGTGEGGVAALVNQYIGRNGIKIFLKGITPGMIQKTELHYINRCDYYAGECSYSFPLNTGDFIKYPLDHLQFDVNVSSNYDITSYDIPSHPGYTVKASDPRNLKLEYIQPKAYLDRDFIFNYKTDQASLGVDFYSASEDSSGGRFALFLRPPDDAAADSVFPKRIFFLLSNSTGMFGDKLSESISAISNSLNELQPKDLFNIVLFSNSISPWKDQPVSATPENIEAAKNFLSSVSTYYGTDLELALKSAFSQIKDESYNNLIMVFTDGRTSLDPEEIESLNVHKAGIFPIGMGDNLDRSRMEMTAALNYGFVTYIEEGDNLSEKMMRVFHQISRPIMTDVAMEYGRADLSDLIPPKAPPEFAGSIFFTTGGYKVAGQSLLSIGGRSVAGMKAYDFRLNFSASDSAYGFVRYLWAKEMIDEIERRIDIYGVNDSLKQKDIDLSLKYNIRCKYTAYIADYSTTPPTTEVETTRQPLIPDSYIAGNYPNPFNPSTTFRIYIDKLSAGKVKLLRVYNILGQLVAVIDISSFREGWHNVLFNGRDFYGASLPSGIYFVQLQIGNNIANTLKINLLK